MKVNGSAISGGVAGDKDGKGFSVAEAKTQATYAPSGLGWSFAGTEVSPWKWMTAPYTLPVLFWQTAATIPAALPTHLENAEER